ncbi:DMT family transporter [Vineibacter terrae]|uniref:DMT family transporter n=1 Tax=Vineibacter terrae TaxID=2586908 RepID=A0A5C8PVG5_9HYPH|nr:DMT family transporter [Vineibacter terrae]TXL82005.1 DMT family transporter [Vineibacter terrae]
MSFIRNAGRLLWRSPAVLLVLTALFWSGNFVVGRAVHGSVPPVALAFWRWSMGFVMVIGFAWPHLRRDLPELARCWRLVLLLSALGVAAFNTMVYIGLQSTMAINALLMQSAMPLVILLCSFVLFAERTGARQLLAVLVSLAGVLVIASRGAPASLASTAFNAGDAWVFGAVVSYAFYSALLRRRPAVHPLSFIAATFALGALMLVPFYAWETASGAPMRWSGTSALAVAYVALFPSLLAYLCFNRGVELIGANRAGQFVHLMPAFGTGLAIVFLGESVHGYHAVGIALIALGIGLAIARRAPPARAPE